MNAPILADIKYVLFGHKKEDVFIYRNCFFFLLRPTGKASQAG